MHLRGLRLVCGIGRVLELVANLQSTPISDSDEETLLHLDSRVFSEFLCEALELIHSSSQFESAVFTLYSGNTSAQKAIEYQQQHGSVLFQCLMAQDWSIRSPEKARKMLHALIHALEQCDDALEQRSQGLQRTWSTQAQEEEPNVHDFLLSSLSGF